MNYYDVKILLPPNNRGSGMCFYNLFILIINSLFTMQNLKINLYGESWTLKKFECGAEDLIKCIEVANKMKLTLAKLY